MERYILDKHLPSCNITKDMARELEKYLTDRLTKKLKGILTLEDTSNKIYKVKLEDDSGEEHLNSINQHHRDKFSNHINSLTFEYSITPQDFTLKIKFSKSPTQSYLYIDLLGEGAKEFSLGIYNEIYDILRDRKNIHFIFHGKYSWTSVAIFSTIMLFFLATGYTNNQKTVVFIALLQIFYIIASTLLPYSQFDTINNEKYNKTIQWILNGMAGVFLFGVIAQYILNMLNP